MTISPVTIVAAAPIKAIDRVQSVKRRVKSALDDDERDNAREPASQRMFAAASPEELASDSTRDGLLNIRLGG
jgi:hypothetical protein